MTKPVVQWCSSTGGSIHDQAVFNLHEIAHRVCQPPGIDTDLVAEQWLIFTLETAWMHIIRAKLPPHLRSDFTEAFDLYERAALFAPFIECAGSVHVHAFYGERLGACSPLRRWRREPDAVQLGLVSSDKTVTWQWPAWPTDPGVLYRDWIRRHRRSFQLGELDLPAGMNNWTDYLHPQIRGDAQ